MTMDLIIIYVGEGGSVSLCVSGARVFMCTVEKSWFDHQWEDFEGEEQLWDVQASTGVRVRQPT